MVATARVRAGSGGVMRAQKIALRPNARQREQLSQAAGVARFAYNWGLAEWERRYQDRKLDPSLPTPSYLLARGIMDQSFGEFRRQLEYQARLTGTVVVVADRWYPSSKVCSGCGHRLQALARSQRRWRCPRRGVDHDRDLNAAKNLEQMAMWSTVSAGGEVGSGGAAVGSLKPASTKQEVRSRALPGSDSLCPTAQVIS